MKRYESNNINQFSYGSENSFEINSEVYQPDEENLEGFFNEAPKDLEQIIDGCSFDNYHLDEENENKCKNNIMNKRKIVNSTSKFEQNLHHNQKKRDAKYSSKKRGRVYKSAVNSINKEYPRKQDKESLESKNDDKSGLIIKIRFGNEIITGRNPKQENCKGKPVKDGTKSENKVKTPGSSCSISTLSIERLEEKDKGMSDCSESTIELDNHTKIICRSIGPLNSSKRREKVLHYLEKKRTRRWNKRINYT